MGMGQAMSLVEVVGGKAFCRRPWNGIVKGGYWPQGQLGAQAGPAGHAEFD